MQLVTGGGAFTRANIQQINDNFAAVANPDVWVRPQYGNNAQNGLSRDSAKATLAGCASLIEPGIVIGIEGVLFEEWASPTGVNDITLVGLANQPRQATTSGVANGGGATWMSPSGGTGHLATLNGQAIKLQNLFLNNSATSGACVLVTNTGDGPALANGEHTQVIGCRLTGAKYGVRSTGLPNWVTIADSTFFGFGDSGDLAISYTVGAGTGTLSQWQILRNQFFGNAGHITAAFAGAEIAYNRFAYIAQGVTTSTQVVLTSGANNSIHNNHFDVPFNVNGLTAMFASGTNDRWGPNSMGTACLTPMTGYVWGVPVSGAA